MERKHILTWGSMLPASILVFLTVNKRAGLQLAAHYWGAVVTHGRIPCSALWFRVTVDARDWREREREREREQSSSESGGRSRCSSPGQIRTRGSSQEGRRVGVSESDGIGKRSQLSEQLRQKQQRSFNLWHLWKILSITWNMNWKGDLGFQSDRTGEYRGVNGMTNKASRWLQYTITATILGGNNHTKLKNEYSYLKFIFNTWP